MINSFGCDCAVHTLLYNPFRKMVYKQYQAYPIIQFPTSLYRVYTRKYYVNPSNMLLGVSEVYLYDWKY